MYNIKSLSLVMVLALVACEPLFDENLSENANASVGGALSRSHNDGERERPTKAERNRSDENDRQARVKRERPRRIQEARAPREARNEEAAKNSDRPGDAPARYSVKLNTTKGDIIIDVTRAWAPRGADRFYNLVKAGYYNDCAFFRVIDGFMAQTGISGDPAVNSQWQTKRIQDDPVEQSNRRGYVSFAMAGPNTRTTQFFISYRDNSRLDQMGFAPFGRVRDMTPVDALYSGYGEGAPRGRGPSQGRLQSEGNSYLRSDFPELDYIRTAQIISQ